MKRAGFTMIELIFVIVILGILAAVAIPKLAATRTDAEVAKITTEVATLISDLGAYYTSQGSFKSKDISNITNVNLPIDASSGSGSAASLANNTVLSIQDSSGSSCFTVTFDDVDDGNVTIAQSAGALPTACKEANTAASNLIKAYSFGGSRIK